MQLLHNCVGVEYWENQLALNGDEKLEYNEGWGDEDKNEVEDLEGEGIEIVTVEELDAPFEDE